MSGILRKFVRHSPIAKNVFLGSRVEALLDRLYERHSAQGGRRRGVARAPSGRGSDLAFVEDPWNGLRTLTLPFDGGLEFTVKMG